MFTFTQKTHKTENLFYMIFYIENREKAGISVDYGDSSLSCFFL